MNSIRISMVFMNDRFCSLFERSFIANLTDNEKIDFIEILHIYDLTPKMFYDFIDEFVLGDEYITAGEVIQMALDKVATHIG